ncbi:hypothetical protein SLEP1_g36218 [Rubroshorea leprosula]|uniref:Membrane-associated kinase regulator 2 n=1 Tax=Rubroshorea leprosula TaxID=152421 RepID=A0AAV5KRB8_9ROSI|nr:hypothetical protein SLEP1_g36218 [Rubroshorea leprosula]
MEAFSLLKYWRGGGGLGVVGGGGGGGVSGSGGGGGGGSSGDGSANPLTASLTTTIVTAVSTHQAVDTDEDDDDDDGGGGGDDGPFFDLEFAVPDEDEAEEETGENDEKNEQEINGEEGEEEENEAESDGEREFNFTLSSGSSNDRSDPSLALSPSDDLFFKGRLVPIEPNSSLDSKPSQFPVSLLKSATKFRVFLLRFKKSKNASEKTEATNGSPAVVDPKKRDGTQEENNNGSNRNKFFTVKFKVEEVPIVSLFTRDNSKSLKQQTAEESVSDEKKFSKDVMQKYLKKVKPLYVRVSRRYGEKLRFSGQLNLGSLKPIAPSSTAAQKPPSAKSTAEKAQPEAEGSDNPTNMKSQKQGNIPAGLRVVCKHLGKSRSASSVAAAPSPVLSQRRDDSLLQQQDGIQSAILHCKRSFNGSRDSESSTLPRSVSDPSHEKSIDLSRNEGKEEKKD